MKRFYKEYRHALAGHLAHRVGNLTALIPALSGLGMVLAILVVAAGIFILLGR